MGRHKKNRDAREYAEMVMIKAKGEAMTRMAEERRNVAVEKKSETATIKK